MVFLWYLFREVADKLLNPIRSFNCITNSLKQITSRWESELENMDRDERKCLMPDRNRCGRSPALLTKDYLFAIEMSDDLFARKVRITFLKNYLV